MPVDGLKRLIEREKEKARLRAGGGLGCESNDREPVLNLSKHFFRF